MVNYVLFYLFLICFFPLNMYAYSVRQTQMRNYLHDISNHKYEPKPHGTNNPAVQRRLRTRIKRSALSIKEGIPMFPVDDGCIRYRLLSSGYSTRLSINEQRSNLMLAFRMWSEVCPICFKEDLNSPIGDIDIQLLFGRRECMEYIVLINKNAIHLYSIVL